MSAPLGVCRCGTPFDSRGLCSHCDGRPEVPCGPTCPKCVEARHWCEVCATRFPTQAMAVHHAQQDRINENVRRNK